MWSRPYLDLTESGWNRLRLARNVDGILDGWTSEEPMCLRRVFGSHEQILDLIRRHNTGRPEDRLVCVDDGPADETPLSALGWEARHLLVYEQLEFEMGTTRLVIESGGISPEAELRDQVIWTVGMSASGDLAAEDLNYDGTINLWEIHLGDLAPLFSDDSLVPGSESGLRLGRGGTQRLMELARNVFSSSAVELPAVDVAVVTRATATDASLDNGFLRIRHHGEIDIIGRWRRRWYERFEQGFRKTFIRGESAASDRLLYCYATAKENGSGGTGAA